MNRRELSPVRSVIPPIDFVRGPPFDCPRANRTAACRSNGRCKRASNDSSITRKRCSTVLAAGSRPRGLAAAAPQSASSGVQA
jgi:hypothetical protein